METGPGYELLDVGDGRRLERFADVVVDRPAPGSLEGIRDERAWAAADASFTQGGGWRTRDGRDVPPWTVGIAGLRLELRATPAGQVGLFPEQLGGLPWLTERIGERLEPGAPPPRVLNLFAYTGLATLALAAAGAEVVHVDASRPALNWARRNAELSGLAERPIRWLVDDVPGLIAREARRGNRYDGIVLDPPSYGHGAAGQTWRLVDGLAPLLAGCAAILAPRGFVLLTAHSPDLGPADLAVALGRALGRPDAAVERGELALEATSGAHLALGAYARSAG